MLNRALLSHPNSSTSSTSRTRLLLKAGALKVLPYATIAATTAYLMWLNITGSDESVQQETISSTCKLGAFAFATTASAYACFNEKLTHRITDFFRSKCKKQQSSPQLSTIVVPAPPVAITPSPNPQ